MKKAVLREYLNSGIREDIEAEIKGIELMKEVKKKDSMKIFEVKRPSIKVSKKKSDK